jgi:hypothetical protein
MNESRVTKRFDLRGRDEWDLVDRVETLRHAIRTRRGAVLSIAWSRDGAKGPHRASVVYEVPVGQQWLSGAA